MNREIFETYLHIHSKEINEIRFAAWTLHACVGQTYDKTLPYGYHLSMVAEAAMRFGHLVLDKETDILPVIFSAFYHDSIEDARITYNDLTKIARKYMTPEQAFTAAEIVYALTNDKGRTRQERAGVRYYEGIRKTPYAPFVKLCDRFANMTHSFKGTNQANNHMHKVYQNEWPHFIESIREHTEDIRFSLPQEMVLELEKLFHER